MHSNTQRTIGLASDAEKTSIWSLAQGIATAEGTPKGLAGNPKGIMAVMLYGRELGMGPMTALAQIDLIKGKPTLSPQGMNALVRDSGAGHSLTVSEITDTSVTVDGERGDSGDKFSYTYTIEQANAAGLTELKYGKPGPWQEYPALMLMARCIGVVCRFLFPDVLGPISYSPEEVGGPAEEPAALRALESGPAAIEEGEIVEVEQTSIEDALKGQLLVQETDPAAVEPIRVKLNEDEVETLQKQLWPLVEKLDLVVKPEDRASIEQARLETRRAICVEFGIEDEMGEPDVKQLDNTFTLRTLITEAERAINEREVTAV